MDHLLALTQRFETSFGDPKHEKNIFSYESCLQLDSDSAFPTSIADRLNDWGVPRYYTPAKFGGSLQSYDELFHLIRLISCRDLTVAIGHGKTMLGSVSVWLSGSDAQCSALAERVLNNEAISLALTERDHGSDVSASGTYGAGTVTGYRLSGEKYLINNGTRSSALTVFARTSTAGNSRDFSMFLVEKPKLASAMYSHLPKSLTHGIKGADISGVRFANAEVSMDALIGKPGEGLEIVLCGFQVTRTLCSALSCGAGDHGLRLAYRFAAQRQQSGRALISRPVMSQTLGRACADLLIADIVGIVSSRAINVIPSQMSVISAIAKAYVPPSIEAMVDGLVDVLGARAYLIGESEFGGFGKVQRDCRLVSLFDGNTLINLQSLLMQLPGLARHRRKHAPLASDDPQLAALFNMRLKTPDLDRDELSLSSKGRDSVTHTLMHAKAQLSALPHLSAERRTQLDQQVDALIARLASLDDFFAANPIPLKQITKLYFYMAERYCKVFAAASCIQIFVHNHERLTKSLQDGEWLVICLAHLLNPGQVNYAPLRGYLQEVVTAGNLISVFPLPLASDYAEEIVA